MSFMFEHWFEDEPADITRGELISLKSELESKRRMKGTWILTQRDKYIDISCSECGYTRIKEYAYNYTVDEIDMQEIKDLVVTSKMNYCECCGAKMEDE